MPWAVQPFSLQTVCIVVDKQYSAVTPVQFSSVQSVHYNNAVPAVLEYLVQKKYANTNTNTNCMLQYWQSLRGGGVCRDP